MAEAAHVASALLTGLVLLAVAVAVARSRYRHPAIAGRGGGLLLGGARRIDGWVTDPAAWFFAFVLATFGAAGAAMAVAVEVPSAGLVLAACAGATALGVTLGTYAAGRSAGYGSAPSLLFTAILVGVAVVLAVSAQLVAL